MKTWLRHNSTLACGGQTFCSVETEQDLEVLKYKNFLKKLCWGTQLRRFGGLWQVTGKEGSKGQARPVVRRNRARPECNHVGLASQDFAELKTDQWLKHLVKHWLTCPRCGGPGLRAGATALDTLCSRGRREWTKHVTIWNGRQMLGCQKKEGGFGVLGQKLGFQYLEGWAEEALLGKWYLQKDLKKGRELRGEL